MITIIVAMTAAGIIGKQNQLPWYIPQELKNFRKFTVGNTIIMGRKTFESIGKPLSQRNNIVLTSKPINFEGIIVCNNVNNSLVHAQSFGKEIFVIGGSQIYEQFLPLANRLLISYIKKDYEGDIYFPKFDLAQWEVIQRTDYPDFELVEYKRNSKV